jgi:predicted DNA-binding protein (MmcQ/YjbR family)
MDIQEVRRYCLSKNQAQECMPFDDMTLVFKVAGKIFALLSLEIDHGLNLKCDPGRVDELRERYSSIKPGYHMNKNHWNTLQLDGTLSGELIREMIDHSYDLIVDSLPKKRRTELGL